MDRLADTVVGAAPAEVAGHRLVDVGVRRVRLALEQRDRAHDLPGLTVAALRDVLVDPGLLDLMQRAVLRGDAFDRRDLDTLERLHRKLARLHRRAVHMYRARAALPDPAAVLRADETERVPQHPQQRRRRVDVAEVVRPAIDFQLHAEFSRLVGRLDLEVSVKPGLDARRALAGFRILPKQRVEPVHELGLTDSFELA